MIDLQSFVEKIRDFTQENRKLTLIIAGSFVILSVTAVVFDLKKAKKVKMVELPETVDYESCGDFFPPEKEPLTEDYYFMRTQVSQWSQEEFDRWFSVPDRDSVEKLGNSNEKMIEEVIGAAP